jgi:demethylmenaquinone methyltransferase/2-methoxy-6-polyprenyl-1,4-benzoquinol methylase
MKKGVQKIFSQIVGTYELINHLLTWGLDIHWRQKAARLAVSLGGRCWLDICTGTGEMAALVARRWKKNLSRRGQEAVFSRYYTFLKSGRKTPASRSKAEAHLLCPKNNLKTRSPMVVGLDFCWEMLINARQTKAPSLPIPLVFIQGDVGHLPFPDGTFAGVSISFATRNLGLTPKTLLPFFQEVQRVLQSGGVFVNLETSQPRPKWLRKMFHIYVQLTVKPLGRRLSGSAAGYAYLAHTIPRFLSPEELRETLLQAGFSRVEVRKLWLGVAAIHLAYKE